MSEIWIPYDGDPVKRHPINSAELVNRLRVEKSVLTVPGDHFGMDGYLRIGFGDETAYLREGLTRLHDLLGEIAPVHV